MSRRGLILFAVASLAALAGAVAQQPSQASFRNETTWWAPADGKPFPRTLDYANATGIVRTLLKDGPAETLGHAFFSPLGSNGRACITCHQPADAMALSLESIRDRWRLNCASPGRASRRHAPSGGGSSDQRPVSKGIR